MIRINLLPVDDRKRTRRLTLPSFSGSSKAVWAIGAVGVYVAMVVALAMLQAQQLQTLDQKIQVAREESAKLAPQLERIRKLTKEREEVNRRLNIIAELDKNRYYRVQVLNDISLQLPSNSWLTSVKEESPTQLSIEGVTFSNFLIADLMTNLEKSDRFESVALAIAEEGRIMDNRVIQFTLQSKLSPLGGRATGTMQ